MNTLSDKKWLIKSDSKILGPFNFEQIEDLLLKRQISLIDEVRDTETRWLYLRENNEFKVIVENIRAKIDSKNDSTKALGTHISQTATIPESEIVVSTQANLPKFTDVTLNIQEASVVSESIDTLEPTEKETAPFSQAQAETAKVKKAKNYAYHNDHRTKQKVQFFSRNLFIGILFIAITISGLFYSYISYNRAQQQKFEMESIAQVKKYKLLGLYQKAANTYSSFSPNLQKKYKVDVLDLFPMLEPIGLVQVKDLDEIEKNPTLTIEEKVNLYLARFWFFMQTQNIESAQNQIVKAKALQPSHLLVIENESLLNLKVGQYQKAIEGFVKLYSQEPSGRFIVGALQSYAGLDQAEKSKLTESIERMVDRHVATKYDYRKELLLAQMYFAQLKENKILFNLSLKQFFNTPTQLQAQFRRPLLVAPFAYAWKDLESYKLKVKQNLNLEEGVQFQIHDYLESLQFGAASDYLEKNIIALSKADLKSQMNLLLYYSLSKKKEISLIEKTDQLDKKSELNQVLLALNKIDVEEAPVLDTYYDFFKANNLKFYDHWIRLAELMKSKNTSQIKSFLVTNYLSESDFILAQEARGLVE